MTPAFEKTDKKKPHTEYEKQLLLQLVQSRVMVLDNRRTDAITLRKKQEAWETLTSEFNNSPNVSQIATSKQLKKMWQNFKAKARDAKTQEAQRKKTGGGPPPPEIGPLENQILAIIPNLLPSIDVEIDSDILYSEDREEEADNESQEWLHKKTKEQIHDRSSATPVLSTSLISTRSTTLVTSTCPLSFTPSSIPLVTSSNPITCTYTPSSETVTYTPSPVTRTITISSAPPTTNQRAKKRTNEDEENLSIEQIKRQIYLEELRNAREKHEMEKEFMLQKQKIELEILNIKKEILLKELNK